MTNNSEANRLFEEVQKFRQWWVISLVIIAAAVAWLAFIVQIILGRPFGSKPASDGMVWILTLVIGVGLPLLLWSLKMITSVSRDRITIRYFPLHTRTINLRDIVSFAPRQYRPIREYGGWGIRFGFGHGTAYNVSGDKGVQLELTGGKRFLIGSQRADELAAVIAKVLGR